MELMSLQQQQRDVQNEQGSHVFALTEEQEAELDEIECAFEEVNRRFIEENKK